MGMIFNIQTKYITWISQYKQYYTILKLLFYKLQSKYRLQLSYRYPLLTHKCWILSFPRCTLFNEHKIAVEDHLPPNKKHTLEDKLALGSLSVHFLGNSALTESASGAITYHGRNSIAKVPWDWLWHRLRFGQRDGSGNWALRIRRRWDGGGGHWTVWFNWGPATCH